jgi:RNA polymerase sigma-70 factor (ECF subfamily)
MAASMPRLADPTRPELVEQARAGDRGAFARLHASHSRMVHAIVLARVHPSEADDLVQDVFLSAWTRLPELKEVGAFGGWLARIARNRATDHGRRRREVLDPGRERGRPSPPRAEARQALEAILALPEAYRETLLMRLVEGMTGPEIAEATGLTAGSVRVNLHRGMKLLRERLGVRP